MLSNLSQIATVQASLSVAEVPKRIRPHWLEQIKGEGSPARFELAADTLVTGRAPDVNLRLAGEKVSRRHALLRRRNQEYSIIDLDSLHGVYLNGIKIHSAVLRDEDLLQLGEAVFIYHEG